MSDIQSSNKTKYLPCRLCGQEASVYPVVNGLDHQHHQVGCNDCGIEVCQLTEQEARTVWNSLMMNNSRAIGRVESINQDRETAREQFLILKDMLYQLCGVGGNLHVLLDDNNTDDSTIESLDKEWLPQQKNNTPPAQWAIERALLDLLMQFNNDDRDYIISGLDLEKLYREIKEENKK